eukprot:6878824-Lingulodinium_polyedra.AAC.1
MGHHQAGGPHSNSQRLAGAGPATAGREAHHRQTVRLLRRVFPTRKHIPPGRGGARLSGGRQCAPR